MYPSHFCQKGMVKSHSHAGQLCVGQLYSYSYPALYMGYSDFFAVCIEYFCGDGSCLVLGNVYRVGTFTAISKYLMGKSESEEAGFAGAYLVGAYSFGVCFGKYPADLLGLPIPADLLFLGCVVTGIRSPMPPRAIVLGLVGHVMSGGRSKLWRCEGGRLFLAKLRRIRMRI